jgi:hypothetical protein
MIQINVNNSYGHMHDLLPGESDVWWQLITAQLISFVVIVSEGQQHAFLFSNSLETQHQRTQLVQYRQYSQDLRLRNLYCYKNKSTKENSNKMSGKQRMQDSNVLQS